MISRMLIPVFVPLPSPFFCCLGGCCLLGSFDDGTCLWRRSDMFVFVLPGILEIHLSVGEVFLEVND